MSLLINAEFQLSLPKIIVLSSMSIAAPIFSIVFLPFSQGIFPLDITFNPNHHALCPVPCSVSPYSSHFLFSFFKEQLWNMLSIFSFFISFVSYPFGSTSCLVTILYIVYCHIQYHLVFLSPLLFLPFSWRFFFPWLFISNLPSFHFNLFIIPIIRMILCLVIFWFAKSILSCLPIFSYRGLPYSCILIQIFLSPFSFLSFIPVNVSLILCNY